MVLTPSEQPFSAGTHWRRNFKIGQGSQRFKSLFTFRKHRPMLGCLSRAGDGVVAQPSAQQKPLVSGKALIGTFNTAVNHSFCLLSRHISRHIALKLLKPARHETLRFGAVLHQGAPRSFPTNRLKRIDSSEKPPGSLRERQERTYGFVHGAGRSRAGWQALCDRGGNLWCFWTFLAG
jgi:hypothetical protein